VTTPLDLRLYLVTDPWLLRDRSLVGVVAAAVEGGVTCVQLRDKIASDDELIRQAKELKELLELEGVPLIVNDRLGVAQRAGASGIHVGVHDVSPQEAREALGPDAVVGWSVETPEQLTDEGSVQACSYVAASPVWVTGTKTDTAAPLGVAGISRLRALTELPLVAIGGIDAPRARDVMVAGADGIAVVSAILAAPDPLLAARTLRTAVDAGASYGRRNA
jgi:thiamine-phosphate pyrophosphorylase